MGHEQQTAAAVEEGVASLCLPFLLRMSGAPGEPGAQRLSPGADLEAVPQHLPTGGGRGWGEKRRKKQQHPNL